MSHLTTSGSANTTNTAYSTGDAKPAKPVQSSEKSGPQLPETGQANDTALLALGVAAEMAAVMGVAYSHRRRKDV
ncbi:MAG: LPXTG cell wall anchor domain-containing protein [Streptococcus salivarius]